MKKIYEIISGLSAIAHLYDVFLLDLYGVVHDGIEPFSEAIDAVNYLKSMRKKIIFFSNTPRQKDVVLPKLLNMSDKLSGIDLCTSGDFFTHLVKHNKRYNLKFLSEYGLPLTQDHNHPLLRTDGLKLTNDISQSHYLLALAYVTQEIELQMFDEIMKKAVNIGIPCICPNPDLIATNGASIVYTAGSFASRYEIFGGYVKYIGKPEETFYQFALEQYIDKSSMKNLHILAIGDNINTDIRGANNFGIDSLFITDGIHRGKNIEELIEETRLKPDYVINCLKI